jgi:hypothetical protein
MGSRCRRLRTQASDPPLAGKSQRNQSWGNLPEFNLRPPNVTQGAPGNQRTNILGSVLFQGNGFDCQRLLHQAKEELASLNVSAKATSTGARRSFPEGESGLFTS